MAKRKRLTPANPAFLAPAPEVKSALARPPIADVASEAASAAAVEEMARSLRDARIEGRMVQVVGVLALRSWREARDPAMTARNVNRTAFVPLSMRPALAGVPEGFEADLDSGLLFEGLLYLWARAPLGGK